MLLLVGDQLEKVKNYKKIPYYQYKFKDENGTLLPLIIFIAVGTLSIAGFVIYRKRRA